MAAPNWYQFNPARWRGSTRVAKMSLAARGAYAELLNFQFQQDNGMIPNEPALMWQYVRCTPGEWESVKAEVLPMFQEIEHDGKSFLRNETMFTYWQHAQESYRRYAEAGAKGGRNKARNRANPKQTPSIATASLQHRSSQNVADLDLDLDLEVPKTFPDANASVGKVVDPRRQECLALIDSHIKATIPNEAARPPFHPNVTVALDKFLKAHPKVQAPDLKAWLDNRLRSDKVNFVESVHIWLKKLPDYAQSPLDEYRKPKKSVRANPVTVPAVSVAEQTRKRMEANLNGGAA